MASTSINLLITAGLLCIAAASIPSSGLVTAEETRQKLEDSEFRIVPWNGTVLHTPNFKARIADLTMFPALGGVDVQFFIARITVFAGSTFPMHYHPRAAEVLTVEKGAARVMFRMETGKEIVNNIHPGQSTIFPQGLMHKIECISEGECLMSAYLNSADPGNIFV